MNLETIVVDGFERAIVPFNWSEEAPIEPSFYLNVVGDWYYYKDPDSMFPVKVDAGSICKLYAPACDIDRRRQVMGDLCFTHHTRKNKDGEWIPHYPSHPIGVGSIVYIQSCFDKYAFEKRHGVSLKEQRFKVADILDNHYILAFKGKCVWMLKSECILSPA